MLDCVVPEDYKVDLIETLHKKGTTQIELLKDDHLGKHEISRDAPLERVNEVSLLLIRVRKILDELKVFEPVSTNFMDDFLEADRRPKTRVDELTYKAVISKANSLLEGLEDKVKSLEEKKSKAQEKEIGLLDEIRSYTKLLELEVNLGSLKNSEYFKYIFWRMSYEEFE